MSHSAAFAALALLLPILPAQEQAGDGKTPVTLKLDLKKGTSAYFKSTTSMQQNIDMGGQAMEMGNEVTMTLEIKGVELDPKGGGTVEVKFHAVRGSMALPMGMGDVEFDSTRKPEAEEGGDESGGMMPSMSALRKAMTTLAGRTLKVKVAGDGEVLEVVGGSELVQEAQKTAGRMGGQMLGGSLNEGSLKRTIQGCFGALPKEPTAPGGTWKKQGAQAGNRGLQMATEMTMKLESADADSIQVQMSGTLALAPKKEEAKDEGKKKGEEEEDEFAAQRREMLSKMKIENGKLTGTDRVSRKDGMVLKSQSEMAMDVTLPGPMGGDMKIQQKSKTVVERTTAEAMMPPAKKDEAKQPEAKEPKKSGK